MVCTLTENVKGNLLRRVVSVAVEVLLLRSTFQALSCRIVLLLGKLTCEGTKENGLVKKVTCFVRHSKEILRSSTSIKGKSR